MAKRDDAALVFIKSYIEVHGYAPSFVDIMDAVGETSKDGVTRMLNRLVKAKKISRVPGVARSICVLESDD